MTLREFIESGRIAHLCEKRQIGAFWIIPRVRRYKREEEDQRVLCTFEDDPVVFKITTDNDDVTFPYDHKTVQQYLITKIEEDERSNHDIDNILDHTYISCWRYKHTIVINVEDEHYHAFDNDPDVELSNDKHTFMLMYLQEQREEEERKKRDKLREEKEVQRRIKEAQENSASNDTVEA